MSVDEVLTHLRLFASRAEKYELAAKRAESQGDKTQALICQAKRDGSIEALVAYVHSVKFNKDIENAA
jgi:hypothetical protein